jgi:hypothetical protein
MRQDPEKEDTELEKENGVLHTERDYWYFLCIWDWVSKGKI